MDELIKYIFKNYQNLMNVKEHLANRTNLVEEKISSFRSGVGTQDMIDHLRKELSSKDPEILALLSNGYAEFKKKVVERILREDLDKIFLNRCPKCEALARTPTAKQCPNCYYSWHE